MFPSEKDPVAVATGNWGCGVFGGDAHLKSLIQLMAASVNGRDLAYFTYGGERLAKEIHEVFQLVQEKGLLVKDLYELIVGYGEGKRKNETFREYIMARLKDNPVQSQQKDALTSPLMEGGTDPKITAKETTIGRHQEPSSAEPMEEEDTIDCREFGTQGTESAEAPPSTNSTV